MGFVEVCPDGVDESAEGLEVDTVKLASVGHVQYE